MAESSDSGMRSAASMWTATPGAADLPVARDSAMTGKRSACCSRRVTCPVAATHEPECQLTYVGDPS